MSRELTPQPGSRRRSARRALREKLVLRVMSRLIVPLILLFALYVQFHGDYGPGGGFQAGVILAAGVILYGLVLGVERARAVISEKVAEILIAVGVLLYGSVGIASMVLGKNYLDYDALGEHGQHEGIIIVELGVGIAVASAMIRIYLAFADLYRTEADE